MYCVLFSFQPHPYCLEDTLAVNYSRTYCRKTLVNICIIRILIMDCYILEYPLLLVDDAPVYQNSLETTNPQQSSMCQDYSEADEKKPGLNKTTSKGDYDDAIVVRKKTQGDTNRPPAIKQQPTVSSYSDGDGNRSEYDDNLISALNEQVCNLKSQIDKQQKCYRKREERLRQLYEEELDIIEEEYQQSMLQLIRKHRPDKTQTTKLGKAPVIKLLSASTLTSKSVSSNTVTIRTSTKGCNTESCLTHQKERTIPDFGSENSETDVLYDQTQSLHSRLDNLIVRLSECSVSINNLKSTENIQNIKKAQNKMLRQKGYGHNSPPQVKLSLNMVVEPTKEILKDDEKTRNEKSTGQTPNCSASHTKPPDPIVDKVEQATNVLEAGDQGWQVVRSKRYRKRQHFSNEASVIAAAINHTPRARPVRQTSAKLVGSAPEVNPRSYASKLQLTKPGKRNGAAAAKKKIGM